MHPFRDWRLALRSAMLLVGGAALGLSLNSVRSSGVPLFHFQPPLACSASEAADEGVAEISLREAAALCRVGSVVFADTRSAARFAEGHVADAVHLPCDATGNTAANSLRRLRGANTVIVYGETSADGHSVAATLREHGVAGDLRVLAGGFTAWENEGLACASGPCNECSLAGSKEPMR